ncbi:MAG: hypothetical protein WD876_03485, partial [Candidatus Pacearchaeota archaeon]
NFLSCVLVDFRFRGIPQKAGQHYIFGGRAEITFSSYALTSEEINKLNEEAEKEDIGDVFSLVEGITTESLEQLKDDIEYFLEEKKRGRRRDAKRFIKPLHRSYRRLQQKFSAKAKRKRRRKKVNSSNF